MEANGVQLKPETYIERDVDVRRWPNIISTLSDRLVFTGIQDIFLSLDYSWSTFCDAGPTINHHCFNVSCLLGCWLWLPVDGAAAVTDVLCGPLSVVMRAQPGERFTVVRHQPEAGCM